MKLTFKHTRLFCFLSAATSATVNIYLSLLFVTLNETYGITLEKLGFLVSLNFVIQIATDYIGALVSDKLGYRAVMISGQLFQGIGLVFLGILPGLMGNAFIALIIATVFFAIGSGLNEVIRSPIMDAIPGGNKASLMSLLHSFYCWGCVLTIGISTAFFAAFGIEKWNVLAVLWSLLSFLCAACFVKTPIATLQSREEKTLSFKELFSNKLFLIMLVLMVCSGAEELSMSQWASMFVEKGLGLSKTTGDLVGPLMFAVTMGIARVLYGVIGHKIDLLKFIIFSSILCIISYAMTVFSSNPFFAVVGCILCGFSVGIMWPGVTSLCGQNVPEGGTPMYGYIAFAGDIGCSAGPYIVGLVAGAMRNADEYTALKSGLLSVTAFPIFMLVFSLILLRALSRKKEINI